MSGGSRDWEAYLVEFNIQRQQLPLTEDKGCGLLTNSL